MVDTGNQDNHQSAVIEDLFAGELDERAVLDKHGVSRDLYHQWLADERFIRLLEERSASAYRESELILARYAPVAASKLTELTDCKKEETARKACLDIIGMQYSGGERPRPVNRPSPADTSEPQQLSEETAGKLLAALAEAEGQ
ncbi:MAG: hypothetical protein JSU70_18295 [Phycisphaerales bacterium]|nr:MAG: hypothetical protein JSU70_18295 [Phycisphaerales bacterium]